MQIWSKMSANVVKCACTGVELRIWLKQGKEKAQTRKGKKTAGKEKKTADKDFRESA